MPQIPDGPSELYCPLWRDRMSKRCRKCPMWQKFRGTNANTGEPIDEWRCSVSMLPTLLVEVAQQTRGVGAATESFRNEVVRRADESRQRIAAQHYTHPLIEAD